MLKNLKKLALQYWNDERGDIGGIVGSVVGGLFGNSAADAQSDAAAAQAQAQKQMYAQSRSDQMPWLSAGGAAVNQLAYLLGLTPTAPPTMKGFAGGGTGANGETAGVNTNWGAPNTNYAGGGFGSLAKPFSMADFQADPGYAFRLSEGEKALERSQAARGGLLSGAAGKAMLDYGQNMGSQEYGNAFDRYRAQQTDLYNRLAGISGTGQVSAGNISNAGQNAANGMGEAYANAGNAKAAGYANMANMFQTGLGYLSNAFNGGGGQYGAPYPNSGQDYGNIVWN